MTQDKHLIFVYGTLKKEDGTYAHQRYLSEATFKGKCSIPGLLIHLQVFPGLVHDPICRVTGEVYEVNANAIHGMDIYEGVPHLYRRERVETPWGTAWSYFKNHIQFPIPDALVCVDRGLWTGGEVDRASYAKVKDFFQNRRWNEPEYRAMSKQPIIDVVPSAGMIGTWDDSRQAFVYPDGTQHTPPGLVHPTKPTNVLPFPVVTVPTPTAATASLIRGVEWM